MSAAGAAGRSLPHSGTRWPRWLALALTTMPMLAQADEKLTYDCTGYLSTESAGSTAIKPVTTSYTLYVSGLNGRYFDWNENQWKPIHVITDDFFQLFAGQNEPSLHATGTATIDRRSGRWTINYRGGEIDVSIGGRCTQVPVREPPAEQ